MSMCPTAEFKIRCKYWISEHEWVIVIKSPNVLFSDAASLSLELYSCHSSTKAFCNMDCKCQPHKSSIKPWTETYCKRLGPCRCLQTWPQSSLCAFAGVLRFSFCLLMSALPQAVTHRCYCHETIWVKSSPGLPANKTMYVCFPAFICVSSVTNQVQKILVLYFPPLRLSVKLLNLKFYCSCCNWLQSASQFFRKAKANSVIFGHNSHPGDLVGRLITHLPSQQQNAFLILS